MALKDDIAKVEGKIDKMDDRLDKIDTHLAVYNEQLKEHIRRTELLEADVEPIKVHVNKVHGALKLLGSVGILLGIIKLIQMGAN